MIEGTRSALRRPRKWLGAAALVTVLSCEFAPAAQAAEATQIGSGVSLGSLNQGLDISGPGKLTIQAYDVGVVGTIAPPLQGLSFSVYNSTGIFGARGTSGELSMDISGPGMYYLNVQAIPSLQSRFQMGLVSWSATFEANASAVPLPASVWFLIAGLAWATGMQRSRAKLARNQSVTYVT